MKKVLIGLLVSLFGSFAFAQSECDMMKQQLEMMNQMVAAVEGQVLQCKTAGGDCSQLEQVLAQQKQQREQLEEQVKKSCNQ